MPKGDEAKALTDIAKELRTMNKGMRQLELAVDDLNKTIKKATRREPDKLIPEDDLPAIQHNERLDEEAFHDRKEF